MSHSLLAFQNEDARMFGTHSNKPSGQREGSWWVCCGVGGIVLSL